MTLSRKERPSDDQAAALDMVKAVTTGEMSPVLQLNPYQIRSPKQFKSLLLAAAELRNAWRLESELLLEMPGILTLATQQALQQRVEEVTPKLVALQRLYPAIFREQPEPELLRQLNRLSILYRGRLNTDGAELDERLQREIDDMFEAYMRSLS